MMFRSGTDRLENRTVARPRELRSAASRDRPERRRRALRLVVESLEDRTVLTTLLTVNSLLDDGTAGTLRAVIGQANSGNDSEYVIRFDPTVTGTITLTQGELALVNSNAAVAAKAITIEGPGASQLAVSGNNASRVFEIMRGLIATLEGLTITGGKAVLGGGIYNNSGGTVTIAASTLNGNSSTSSPYGGGGIFNDIGGVVTVITSTLSDNSAIAGGGGGVLNRGTLMVTNSTLSGNSATNNNGYGGGGIYNDDGTVTVTNSTLSGNSTTDSGGGIYNNFGGTVTVTNSTFSGNSSARFGFGGGGIFNHSDGTVTITNSTLSGNSAYDSGGGIYNNIDGTVTVTNSTLSGNSARYFGGGLYSDGTLTVTNSTLSGNSADHFGGGIAKFNGGPVTVTNSTLSGNSATVYGGGIYINSNNIAKVTLSNAIVAGNQGPFGPDASGIVTSHGHNLIGVAPGSSGWISSDLTGTAEAPLVPLLGPLQDNGGPTQTMALLPGSPALNAGAAVPGLTTDQRGIARPQGSAIDIGAFESRGFVLTIVSGGIQSTVVGQSFGQPLVVSVSSPFGEPVDGGVVRFTAPGNGPSTASTTGSATIAQGKASLTAVANTQAGSYVVIASTLGVSQPESFRLTNTPGIPTQVTAISGTPQTAMVTTAFAQPLVVRVTDPYGNPVPGVTVTFAAGGTGPGASFGGATTFTTTTDAAGVATAQATANTETGQYVVTAAVAGLTPPVGFALTNSPPIVPSVVDLQRLGFHRQPTRLVLNFSAELDPSRASAPQNYALFHAGRDGLLGTLDDQSIGLARVAYDPAGPIVTLRPNRRLSLKRRYTLVVRGTPPDGLASPSGGFLAGDGQPGTDYVTTFGREILIRPRLAKSSGSPGGPKAGSMSKVDRSRSSHHG